MTFCIKKMVDACSTELVEGHKKYGVGLVESPIMSAILGGKVDTAITLYLNYEVCVHPLECVYVYGYVDEGIDKRDKADSSFFSVGGKAAKASANVKSWEKDSYKELATLYTRFQKGRSTDISSAVFLGASNKDSGRGCDNGQSFNSFWFLREVRDWKGNER